jgi:hypothetical protein
MGKLLRAHTLKYLLTGLVLLMLFVVITSWYAHTRLSIKVPLGDGEYRFTLSVDQGQFILFSTGISNAEYYGPERRSDRDVYSEGWPSLTINHERWLPDSRHGFDYEKSWSAKLNRFRSMGFSNSLLAFEDEDSYFDPPVGWWATVKYRYGLVHSSLVLVPSVALVVWIWYLQRAARPGRCTDCGYSLEGLATTTCPECGATITHA